jgi:uncharacterized protein (TIGR00251 family)
LPITATKTGIRIAIKVAPRSSREAVLGAQEGVLKVALTAPPVDGEANAALLAFLARTLGVSKRQVTLARGATSKTKLVEVEGVDLATGRERLGL